MVVEIASPASDVWATNNTTGSSSVGELSSSPSAPQGCVHAQCILGMQGRVFSSCDEFVRIFGYTSTIDLLATPITTLCPTVRLSEIDFDAENKHERHTCGYMEQNGSYFPLHISIEKVLTASDTFHFAVSVVVRLHMAVTLRLSAECICDYDDASFCLTCQGGTPVDDWADHSVVDVLPDIYSDLPCTSAAQCFAAQSTDCCAEEMDGCEKIVMSKMHLGCFEGHMTHHDKYPIDVRYRVCRVHNTSTFIVTIVYSHVWALTRQHRHPSVLPPHIHVKDSVPSRLSSEGYCTSSTVDCATDQDEEEEELSRTPTQHGLTMSASCATVGDSAVSSQASRTVHRLNSIIQAEEGLSVANECVDYSMRYQSLLDIGQGSFGSVKLAACKTTGRLVVSKFVRKKDVISAWVDGYEGRFGGSRVPMEVHILLTCRHSNIITALDIFENDEFFALVMEKCGPAMDLFELIQRRPNMDECLAAYMFNQVADGVAYLHLRDVVHRDIKDENVVVDNRFRLKLIDFGSAAFYGPGIVFKEFAGTKEFCSPEIWNGHSYAGPELDMWTLGILLYVLMYNKYPFKTREESTKAELHLPAKWSKSFESLQLSLLHPSPFLRATMRQLQTHTWMRQSFNIDDYPFDKVLNSNLHAHEVDPPFDLDDLETILDEMESLSVTSEEDTEEEV